MIRIPANAGPATAPNCEVTLFSAEAAMKLCSSTSCGVIERCAPTPMLNDEEISSWNTYRSQTCGCESAAFAARPMLPPIMPSCWTSIRRLRSTASAIAPPITVSVSSGTRCVSEIRPTASVEPVSLYI